MPRSKADRERSRLFNASLKPNEIALILTADQVEGVRDAVADMIDGLGEDIIKSYKDGDDPEVIRMHEDLEFFEGLKMRIDKYAKRARAQIRKEAQKTDGVSPS